MNEKLDKYKCHIAEDIIRANVYNKRAQEALEVIKKNFTNFYGPEEADVIVTLGGDGTMLKTIHHYYNKFETDDKVFFGYGFGTANFLLNKWDNFGSIHAMVGNLAQVPIEVARVRSLLVSIEAPNADIRDQLVVNDVVVGGEDLMAWQHFSVQDSENVFGSFNGTGLIVSTAVGSTGYNKNNGGVVLPLLSSNISITGMGTNRPIREVIHAQEIKISFDSRMDSYIWIDGNGGKLGPFKEGTVTIKPGPWLNLGFFDTQEYQIKRRK